MKKKIITALVFCAIIYMAFAFLTLSFNPADWSFGFRYSIVWVWLVVVIIVLMMDYLTI